MSYNAPDLLMQQQTDKIDSHLDYLGLNYDSYCNEIYSMSISQPTKFYEIRNKVLKDLNTELLEKTHSIILNILRYGQ